MIFKYTYLLDSGFFNIPQNVVWSLELKYDSLYLDINGKQHLLREADSYCSGRPNLPDWEVIALYKEMVEVVLQKITAEEFIKYIDIDEIETELLRTKYETLWLENGYIELSENGSW